MSSTRADVSILSPPKVNVMPQPIAYAMNGDYSMGLAQLNLLTPPYAAHLYVGVKRHVTLDSGIVLAGNTIRPYFVYVNPRKSPPSTNRLPSALT